MSWCIIKSQGSVGGGGPTPPPILLQDTFVASLTTDIVGSKVIDSIAYNLGTMERVR